MPDNLEALIDEINDALLNGKTHSIPAIGARLEALLATFHAAPESTSLLRLREKVTRSQALLGAASQGIRAAMRRVEEIQHAQLGSEFYDEAGQRHTIAKVSDRLSRRL